MERNAQQFCRSTQDGGYCAKLKAGACQYRHPPQCKKNTTCWNTSCTYLHDNEICRNGAKCYSKNCPCRHSRDAGQQDQTAQSYKDSGREDKRRDNQSDHRHENRRGDRDDQSRGANNNREEHGRRGFNNNRDEDTRSEISRSSRGDREGYRDRGTQSGRSDREDYRNKSNQLERSDRDRATQSERGDREGYRDRDNQSERGDSVKKERSPLEELLADRRKFSAVLANVRAIGYARKALWDFDEIVKATGKTLYRLTKLLEADSRQEENSILRRQVREVTARYRELGLQRRAVTYTIFGAVKALTGPSITVNYLILRELNRLKEHLPILSKRYEITEAVKKSPFVIVQSMAGCGKSTQLAQYLADLPEFALKKYACGNRKYGQVGGLVGYRVQGAKKVSRWTRIEYITDRTLLQILKPTDDMREMYDKALRECGVIIIDDDAQERSTNTDLLFGVLKLLRVNYPHLKIVVTATTLADATLFSQYFDDCPVISVPERIHPIRVVHKRVPQEGNEFNRSILKSAIDVLRTSKPDDGDVLCFVLSPEDAEQAATAMQGFIARERGKLRCRALCLHENQSSEELQEVLTRPQGFRRVIFATGLAETVYLNGVRYIIDCGMTRSEVWDSRLQKSQSKLQFISKTSAILRRDLAGRERPGTCFRLYSEADFGGMPVSSTPKIFSTALPQISASLLWMKLNPATFPWLESPKRVDLDSALKELVLFKAVKKLDDGGMELSPIGHLVAVLQMEPRIVHMLYNACTRGLGQSACLIAGLLSVATGIFWRSGDYETRKASDAARLKFASPNGDIAMLYRVYLAWVEQKNAKITQLDASSSVGDEMDIGDTMGLNNYETRSDDGAMAEPTIDNAADSSDDSDGEGNDETMSEPSEAPEEPQPMEVESNFTDDSSMQLEEASTMGDDEENRVEDKKARLVNVRKWCRENYVYNKALIAAETFAANLQRALIKYGAWNLSDNQETQPDEQTIQRMVFDASILNLCAKIRGDAVQAVMTKTVASVSPLSSILLRGEPLPKFIVYNNMIVDNRVFLAYVTPVNEAWLKDYPEIEANINDLNIEQVKISSVPQAVLESIAGRYNAKIQELSEALNCMVEVDVENGHMIAWCSPNRVAEVRQNLQERIDNVQRKTRSEAQEEKYTGGTRVVWGEGGEVITLLQEDEFVAFTIENLPLSVTEERLFNIVAAFSKPRTCTLTPSPDKTVQLGYVSFGSSVEAASVFNDMKGAKIESNVLIFRPYGVAKKELEAKSRGYLQISAALAPKKGNVVLTFNNRLNAGQAQTHFNTNWADRPARRVTKLSNLQTQKFKLLFQLFPEEDEFELRKSLANAGQQQPNQIILEREEIDQNCIEELKDYINKLDELLPHYIRDCSVHRSFYFDEKTKRGGVKCFFGTTEEVERAANDIVVVEKLAIEPQKYDQPVRIEKVFSMSMCINAGVWKMFEQNLRRVLKSRKSNVKPVVNQRQHMVVVDLYGDDESKLEIMRRNIDNELKCTVFTHLQKNLLFTTLGKKRLLAANLPIQWDRAGVIRIYGVDADRTKIEAQLNQLVDQLLALVLNETFIIKRASMYQLKKGFNELQKISGVEELKLCGGRLTASGTKEAVEKLRGMIADMIVVPKKATERTEDECPICIDSYDEPVTLQSCGHTFCKACLEGYLGQTTLPVPLCCPLNCKPLVVKDLIALASPDVLEHVKQTAIEQFLINHSHEYSHCPKTGCAQVVKIPRVVSEEEEKKAGGRVLYCDQCAQDYCYTCCKLYNAPITKHSSFTCKEQQAMLHPSIQQHVRFIQNELLISACPRCKRAFLDFSGCCAVTCECGAGFCGLCLVDTNGDAHAHVPKCPLKPANATGVFHSAVVIMQCQGIVKKRKLIEYLRGIKNLDDRRSVFNYLFKDMADLKIELTEAEIM